MSHVKVKIEPVDDAADDLIDEIEDDVHAWQSPVDDYNSNQVAVAASHVSSADEDDEDEYEPSLNPDELQDEWIAANPPDDGIVATRAHGARVVGGPMHNRVFTLLDEKDDEEIKNDDDESPTIAVPVSLIRRMVDSIPGDEEDDDDDEDVLRDALRGLDRALRMILRVADNNNIANQEAHEKEMASQ